MILNPYRFSTAGGTGFLLDDYPGASAAYSLRELTTTSWNIGDVVIQARNSNNDTETFTSAEVFDGTLVDFANLGDGSAFVQRWYDQSGNGNNILQSTNALQPLIVSGGVLLADGLKFNGTDQYFDCGFNHGTTSAQSIFTVAQTSDLTGNRMLIDGRDANDDGIGMFYLTSSDFIRFHVDATDVFSNTSLSANTEYLFSGIYGSTTSTFYEDGTQTDTDTGAPASSSSTTNYHIGRVAYTSLAFWQGSIQEVIIYPDDQSANQAGIDGNITTHYGI
jgi:hypothetical protein